MLKASAVFEPRQFVNKRVFLFVKRNSCVVSTRAERVVFTKQLWWRHARFSANALSVLLLLLTVAVTGNGFKLLSYLFQDTAAFLKSAVH